MLSFGGTLLTLLTVVLAIVFKSAFGPRHRFVWTPMVFAFYLASVCGLIRLASSGYVYLLLFLLSAVARAYLLCGLSPVPWQRNPVVSLFLAFWGYFEFAVVFGEAPLYAIYYYLKAFEVIAVGYYTGIWAISTPRGVHRLFLWGAVAASVVALCWIVQGGLLGDSNLAQERIGVSAEKFDLEGSGTRFNVNGIALSLSAVIPYAFLFIFENARLWMRVVAMGTTFVLAIMIVRTGARNGALALLPMAWYLFCAKTTLSVWKKILIVLVLLGSLGGYFVHMEKDTGKIRAFELFSNKETGDEMGSGRIRLFRQWTQEMGNRKLLGAGAYYKKNNRRFEQIGNLHSMYMQIWYQSGYVGCVLFLIFVVGFTVRALRARGNPYRHAALLLFGVWLVTGVGEAANINYDTLNGFAKVGLGIALAFCSRRRLIPADGPYAGYVDPRYFNPPRVAMR